jgi:hypothetical protein
MNRGVFDEGEWNVLRDEGVETVEGHIQWIVEHEKLGQQFVQAQACTSFSQ